MKGVSFLLTQDRHLVNQADRREILSASQEPVKIRLAPFYQMLRSVIGRWISTGKGSRKQSAIRSLEDECGRAGSSRNLSVFNVHASLKI